MRDASYEQFIRFLEAFVAGRNTSREHVAAMESHFAQHFDGDPRFNDLQYELAMFGADGHPNYTAMVTECEWALKLLQTDGLRGFGGTAEHPVTIRIAGNSLNCGESGFPDGRQKGESSICF